MAIKTVDVEALAAKTGNLYETVAIISKRARQVASNTKSELDDKLSYFEGFGPEMEDARMQEEQAKISIEYEQMPEPTEVAIKEVLNDEIYHRNPNE
jgi:DNA-directed RNA polymerase subunit K/omega